MPVDGLLWRRPQAAWAAEPTAQLTDSPADRQVSIHAFVDSPRSSHHRARFDAFGVRWLGQPGCEPTEIEGGVRQPGGEQQPQARAVVRLESRCHRAGFFLAHAIRESVWVLAPDFDGNGRPDRVTVDIIRPRELANSKVPVIMDASPYYLCCGRGNESEKKTYDADGNPRKFPLFYDNYFVPRGYAVAEVDMAGTGRSTGCVDEGARSDILSVKAVIDWLNGRATAVDSAGKPVVASWTTGSVGMIGKSYDATLANGVAATGVEGLKTIVPISAISSWYDYDRYEGLPFSYNYPSWLSSYVEQSRTQNVNCTAKNNEMAKNDADETGRYTPFWSKRDYREFPAPDAFNVKASVFLAHGLQDTNVKTTNMGRWWADLKTQHIQAKMWLSRLGHTDPFDYRRALWVHTLHLWFDRELLGIHNGVLAQPRVDAETSPGQWVASNNWPVADRQAALSLTAGGRIVSRPPNAATVTFVNDKNLSESQAVSRGNNPGRLLFLTGTLSRSLRLSGQPSVNLRITPGQTTGQVGVALVDYGTQVRVPDNGAGNRTLSTQSCWGKSTSYDDSCYYNSVEARQRTPLAVVARGWARLAGGQTSDRTVKLTYNDVVIPAGHQIGLAVFGASPDWTVTVDNTASQYQVDLGHTTLSLPEVGPMPTFAATVDWSLVPVTLPAGTVPSPNPATRLPD